MDRLISLKESEKQWKFLLKRTASCMASNTDNNDCSDRDSSSNSESNNNKKRPAKKTRGSSLSSTLADHINNNDNESASSDENGGGDEEDPFDCTKIFVPDPSGLVEPVLEDFVQRWRDLDARKVVGDDFQKQQKSNEKRIKEEGHEDPKALPKFHIAAVVNYLKHVRFPENFDYATRLTEPPVAVEAAEGESSSDDRIVSLNDPEKKLSYHHELWKLFHDIPIIQDLENEALQGCKLHRTAAIKNEIMERLKEIQKIDGHALSRLRMSARHELPPLSYDSDDDNDMDTRTGATTMAIRFECWKRQLQRGSLPDPNRMVMEFAAGDGHTLYDIHKVIVELTEDDLWTTTKTSLDATASTAHDDDDSLASSSSCSGFFLIENVFYVTGSVDYVTPIQNWLRGSNASEGTLRAKRLGLSTRTSTETATKRRNNAQTNFPLPVKCMKDVRVEDIDFRLGVRYLHVHHGDVECSVFVVDQRLVKRKSKSFATADVISSTPKPSRGAPILHDIWTPSYSLPMCEACCRRPAAIAASTTSTVTAGHRTLCESCSRSLQLQKKHPQDIERHSVWRNQADLSVGASQEILF